MLKSILYNCSFWNGKINLFAITVKNGIPASMGCIAFGINEIGGKYICHCGESWYAFE